MKKASRPPPLIHSRPISRPAPTAKTIEPQRVPSSMRCSVQRCDGFALMKCKCDLTLDLCHGHYTEHTSAHRAHPGIPKRAAPLQAASQANQESSPAIIADPKDTSVLSNSEISDSLKENSSQTNPYKPRFRISFAPRAKKPLPPREQLKQQQVQQAVAFPLSFQEALGLYNEIPQEKPPKKSYFFVCGCGNRSNPFSKQVQAVVSKLTSFKKQAFDPANRFHSLLLDSVTARLSSLNSQESLQESLSLPCSALSLFFFIFMHTYFPAKFAQIAQSFPLVDCLVKITALFAELLESRKLSPKLFCSDRPFDSCLLWLSGLVLNWFDLFVEGENPDLVSKKLRILAISEGARIIELATQYREQESR